MKIQELIGKLRADPDYRSLLDEPELVALGAKDPTTELREEEYISLESLLNRLGTDLQKELALISGYEEKLELLDKEMEESE